MSKIEIDLKDDFQINIDGHSYSLPQYEVAEGKGLLRDFGMIQVEFVRGSKLGSDNVEPKKGTLHEHLLKMMIHDLTFKNKLVPSRETSLAITKLEEAYNFLLQRQISRVKEGTLNTYKK